MRFTAFDFETCNGSSLSAVDLGIAVYDRKECWRLIETRSWRFYPIEDEFWGSYSSIHGIFKHHVDGLPGFIDRWPEIEPYFRDALLVAHNAPFDVRILCSHLDHCQIERPNSSAHCTLTLARKHLRCDTGKLPDVCKLLRIPLQHHNSVSDAVAAGRIYSHLYDRHWADWNPCSWMVRDWTPGNSSFEDGDDKYRGLAVSVGIGWTEDGQLQGYEEDLQSDELANELYEKAERCFEFMEGCSRPILDGWAFSITGNLLIERADFVAMIRKLGAKCGDKGEFYKRERNCCGPTNSLIISEQELRDILDGKAGTKKLKDAIAARNKGIPMVIVPEEHFYDLVCKREPIPREGFQECEIADVVWSTGSNDS